MTEDSRNTINPQPQTLAGKTIVMSGGSRGIGLSIALQAAKNGANLVLLSKTDTPHPSLEGTIHTAVEQINQAGGTGLAVVGDVRKDEDVARMVDSAVQRFGGIDIVINNASAINLAKTDDVDMKRYDLMMDINVRGAFLLSKTALPHLRKSAHPHILTLSPPLNLDPRWAGAHLAYTMSKYGMSMTTLGLAEELKDEGIGVNSLWPATLIDTAAIRNLPGGGTMIKGARDARIVAEAATAILASDPRSCSGNFFTDEQVLSAAGVTDFDAYATDPTSQLVPDIFL
ncbi:NAD(P)-dependent oxidoreductase [Glutamicibacter sp. V16R2B1]|uniref:SDR family oxidoreductase n=1 Tax=Glutamicibacter sp. V16R2B1 TaxID=2036207 RepID=UPI0010FDBD55|nr:NAD(P)-dependent oxidoreductase [Glutamicibacter sp. V16R2B1]TLK53572.1 NAD(P)-dependent oxidoreductase [Glutamicibacter sp. V16R2B1]